MKSVFIHTYPQATAFELDMTMELYTETGDLSTGSGIVEKVNEEGQILGNHIGLWWDDNNELYDYDGEIALTSKTIDFIRKSGITITKDFELSCKK